MFRENIRPKKPHYQARPYPKIIGTDVPGYLPVPQFGHITREPNTQYDVQMLFYNQRKREDEDLIMKELKDKGLEEKITAKYLKHFDNKRFARRLKEKVQSKMEVYDCKIDERRKKLTDIIWKEEREYTYEVIDKVQKEKEISNQEKEQKIRNIQEKKEIDRLKIVDEKKMQQYLDRCVEFRPLIAVQRYKESAEVQKIQMQENEAKKMSEKELEHFWFEMKEKYYAAIDEREEQDRLLKVKRQNEFFIMNDLLQKSKIAEKQQREREKIQEREELDKLIKDIEEEERAFAEKMHRNKKALFDDCQKQMKDREEILRKAAEDEKKIQEAYDVLTEELIRLQKEKELASSSQAAKDKAESVKLYRKFMEEMKQQEQKMEEEIDYLIQADMKEMQRKDDEKRCATIKEKEALQASVLKIRDGQLEEKKKREEELRKKAQLEADLRLESEKYYAEMKKEYNRVKYLHQKKYQNDLKEQIAYSKVLAEREEENNKKILESAKVEDELYDSIVKKVLSGEAKICETHPFRVQIDNEKCPCPKPNY